MTSESSPVALCVLVIDDETQMQRLLTIALEAAGYRVSTASTGHDGLALIARRRHDLIILDLGLPDISGLLVLKQLREWTQTPVIVLTVQDGEAEKVEALDTGADDYVTKPFSFEEVQARLQCLLRRPSEFLDKLCVHDLELDRMRHSVTRGGKPITLTQREYAVLEYLMRNAGRAVTRTMVVEHVWNLGFEGLTNIVDVYINYLRQKIDQGHDRPLIRTERGVGYMITSEN